MDDKTYALVEEMLARCGEEVTRIWKEYHRLLTDSDDIQYDEHGSLYGFITKYVPHHQTAILNTMYESGFIAGFTKGIELRVMGRR